MQRKCAHVLDHQTDATALLKESGISLETLEREWKAQRDAQLEKPPVCIYPVAHETSADIPSGQSKNLADRTITNVIEGQGILRNMKKKLKKAKDELQRKLGTGMTEETNLAQTAIDSLTSEIATIEGSIAEQKLVLGFTGKGSLEKLKGNAFLQFCTNALALRWRIVQNLIARKFEMEKMERLVHHGNQMGKCFPFTQHSSAKPHYSHSSS